MRLLIAALSIVFVVLALLGLARDWKEFLGLGPRRHYTLGLVADVCLFIAVIGGMVVFLLMIFGRGPL